METQSRSPHAAAWVRPTPRCGRRISGLAAVVLLPLTAGCAANFHAQTQQQYQPGVGSDNRDTAIYVLNALVVADDSGDGTLVGTVLNSDPRQTGCPDYLVDLQVVDNTGGGVQSSKLPSAEAVTAPDGCDDSAPKNGLALAAQQPARLPEDATVQLSSDAVAPGTFITLTLRFQSAEPIEIDVPVVPESDTYGDVTVGSVFTPNDDTATPAK